MTEYEFIQRVKRKLRMARTDSEKKMIDIYKSTDLSYPTICKSFERGDTTNITLITLKQLCDAMDVSLASIFSSPELTEKMEVNNKRAGR